MFIHVPLRRRLLSTKTLLTLGSLVAVFILAAMGRDVRQLEVIVPAILLFYNTANVAQDVLNKKNKIENNIELNEEK